MLAKEVAQTYTYDNKGNLVATTANAEQEINTVYNDKNDLTSYTDTLGNKTRFTYDDKHNLLSTSSARGVKSENTYNAKGLMLSNETHNGSLSSVNNNSEDYIAPTMGIRTEQEYFSNNSSTAINEGAFVKSVSDEHNNKTSYTYNYNTGNILTVTAPNGAVTVNGYNSNFTRQTSVTNGTNTVGYTYDKDRLSSIIFGSGSDSEKYEFKYDRWGNVEQTLVGEQPLSTNTFGKNNNLLTKTEYGTGDTIVYTYSNLGNKKSEIHNGTGYYYWNYLSDGTLSSHLDKHNDLGYHYEYDSLGRMAKQTITDYDNDEFVGYVEQGYDKRNNVNNLIFNIGGRTFNQSYNYNTSTYNSASSGYTKDNLPTHYKISSGQYKVYDYDSLNRRNLETYVNGTGTYYTNYQYKISDRNTGENSYYRTTQLGAEYILDDVYLYTYDNMGNITKINKAERETAGSSTAALKSGSSVAYRSYEYYQNNQLKRENNKSSNKTIVWTYDILGNIDKVKKYGYNETTATGSLSAPETEITYDYTNDNKDENGGKVGWNNLLTSVKTVEYNPDGTEKSSVTETITYDKIGNPKKYLGADLTWKGRQLTGYSDANNTITYKYDSEGLRASKTVNGVEVTYTYIGDKLVYQHSDNGTLKNELYFFYDSFGKLTHLKYYKNGTLHNYHIVTNSMGDVISIYNTGNELVANYEYDAWGNVVSIKDASGNVITDETNIAIINPIRYRGYYYDSETELYYLQSRYYNPEIGRFLNADGYLTTGQGVLSYNMFAYCQNNPIMYSDPSGCFSILTLLVGAIAVGALSLLSRCSKPKDFRENKTDSQNCYTYAFDIEGVHDPGDLSSTSEDDKLADDKIYTRDQMTDFVKRDLECLNKEYRVVSSPSDKLENEIIVAMNINSPDNPTKFDYHFAVQLSNGKWADKVGYTEAKYNRIDGSAKIWEINEYQIYDDGPVFFAIGN